MVVWCCLHLAYDLFLVLLRICLNAIYVETLLTWQSDICSIFHMVSILQCFWFIEIPSTYLPHHRCEYVMSSCFSYIFHLVSCVCLSSKQCSSVSCMNEFWRVNFIAFSCRYDVYLVLLLILLNCICLLYTLYLWIRHVFLFLEHTISVYYTMFIH